MAGVISFGDIYPSSDSERLFHVCRCLTDRRVLHAPECHQPDGSIRPGAPTSLRLRSQLLAYTRGSASEKIGGAPGLLRS